MQDGAKNRSFLVTLRQLEQLRVAGQAVISLEESGLGRGRRVRLRVELVGDSTAELAGKSLTESPPAA